MNAITGDVKTPVNRVLRCISGSFYLQELEKCIVDLSFYRATIQADSARDPETFARPLFSTHASCLLSVLLLYEVAAKVLTMARAVEGSVLLAGCTAKLFFYDFATPGDPHRIASFIELGLLLIDVGLHATSQADRSVL